MDIFEEMARRGHEQVVFCYDRETGLRLVVGIHDTTLGPALGGCRMWTYAAEDDAVTDVLRLSQGMSYKNAAMGLDLGGGKCVILDGGQKTSDRAALFRAVGRFVNTLGGRYITAEDVGTSTEDMEAVAEETPFVRGLKSRSGDPSPATAFGVFLAIKASLRHVFGSDDLEGRSVAIQGLGHVGMDLARRLFEEGARLLVTDIRPERIQFAEDHFEATCVRGDAIFGADADVFAPCALGAVLNDATIPRLKVKIVAGSANNQLAEPRHAAMLAERGILYAPDFVVNGGGVINVAAETGTYDPEAAMAKVATIYDLLSDVFRRSDERGILPVQAAEEAARERIERAGRRMFMPHATPSPLARGDAEKE